MAIWRRLTMHLGIGVWIFRGRSTTNNATTITANATTPATSMETLMFFIAIPSRKSLSGCIISYITWNVFYSGFIFSRSSCQNRALSPVFVPGIAEDCCKQEYGPGGNEGNGTGALAGRVRAQVRQGLVSAQRRPRPGGSGVPVHALTGYPRRHSPRSPGTLGDGAASG